MSSTPKRATRHVENWYPSVISAAVTITIAVLLSLPSLRTWRPAFVRGSTALVPAALNISAIAIGFLATSLSILLSLARTKLVTTLKKTGHHRRLIGFFRRGILVSFLWALVSALLTTVNLDRGGVWRHSILYLWVFLSVCAILCYYRASDILLEILKVDAAPPNSETDELRPEDLNPEKASFPAALDLTEDDR